MKEHDMVTLTNDLHDLAAGATGTIVHEHIKGEVFVVEFCDERGHTLALEDISVSDLELVTAFSE